MTIRDKTQAPGGPGRADRPRFSGRWIGGLAAVAAAAMLVAGCSSSGDDVAGPLGPNAGQAGNTAAQVLSPTSAPGTIELVAGNRNYPWQQSLGPAAQSPVNPWGIAVDATGNTYIANPANHVVEKVDAKTGALTVVAGTGQLGQTQIAWPNGVPTPPARIGVGPATQQVLAYPCAVALDNAGHLYFADGGDNTQYGFVYSIDLTGPTAGQMSLIAGGGFDSNNGPAVGAYVQQPGSIAVDGGGYNLYIADGNGHVVDHVSLATGQMNVVAGNGVAGNDAWVSGNSAVKQQVAPSYVAVDNAGNLLIVDESRNSVASVGPSGTLTVIDGLSNNPLIAPQAVAVDASGTYYVTTGSPGQLYEGWGNEWTGNTPAVWKKTPTGQPVKIAGNRQDNYPSFGSQALNSAVCDPQGIAIGSTGVVYVADTQCNLVYGIVPTSPPPTQGGGTTGNAALSGLSATFSPNLWGGSTFGGTFTIANTKPNPGSWVLQFDLPGGETISSVWGGTMTSSPTQTAITHYQVTSPGSWGNAGGQVGFNGTLPKGGYQAPINCRIGLTSGPATVPCVIK